MVCVFGCCKFKGSCLFSKLTLFFAVKCTTHILTICRFARACHHNSPNVIVYINEMNRKNHGQKFKNFLLYFSSLAFFLLEWCRNRISIRKRMRAGIVNACADNKNMLRVEYHHTNWMNSICGGYASCY